MFASNTKSTYPKIVCGRGQVWATRRWRGVHFDLLRQLDARGFEAYDPSGSEVVPLELQGPHP
jgi:hypothetical protein